MCLFCLGLSVYPDSHYCALLSRELLCVTCLSLCCVVCIVFWFVCVGVCVWRSSVLRCFMLLAFALGSAAYSAVATAKAFVVAIHKYLAGPTPVYFAATATGYSAVARAERLVVAMTGAFAVLLGPQHGILLLVHSRILCGGNSKTSAVTAPRPIPHPTLAPPRPHRTLAPARRHPHPNPIAPLLARSPPPQQIHHNEMTA